MFFAYTQQASIDELHECSLQAKFMQWVVRRKKMIGLPDLQSVLRLVIRCIETGANSLYNRGHDWLQFSY